MKVFISWSGDVSHKVAVILRDWLPSVIQVVEPYVSSEDIDKGARWSTDIAKELEASAYGVLCVTRDNLEAPWLNFEAGALSKTIDKSHVSPFLFGVKRAEVKGPILQFQSTIYDKDDVKKLVQSINHSEESPCLDDARFESVFDVWWPKLQEELDGLVAQAPPQGETEQGEATGDESYLSARASTEILEEVLELVRSQQKLLNSPEAILPRDYIRDVFPRGDVELRGHQAFDDLFESWSAIRDAAESPDGEDTVPKELLSEFARRLERPVLYLVERYRRRRRR